MSFAHGHQLTAASLGNLYHRPSGLISQCQSIFLRTLSFLFPLSSLFLSLVSVISYSPLTNFSLKKCMYESIACVSLIISVTVCVFGSEGKPWVLILYFHLVLTVSFSLSPLLCTPGSLACEFPGRLCLSLSSQHRCTWIADLHCRPLVGSQG